MKFSFILVGYLGICSTFSGLNAQEDSTAIRKAIKTTYRKNQYKLDKNHSGIGYMAFQPKLGTNMYAQKPWVGVNMLTDIFEMKLAFGELSNFGIEMEAPSLLPISKDYGYLFSMGANIPLNFMNFGAQKSYNKIFRGHPILGVSLGAFGMRDSTKFDGRREKILFLNASPGYRLRFPYMSVDFTFDINAGIYNGIRDDLFKGFSFYPTITLRFDGLKQLFSPSLVSVDATQTTLSNFSSTTTVNREYRSSGTVDVYTTYYSGNVSVSNTTIGIQDIGPHLGIGPKVSFTSPAKDPYISPGYLIGFVAQGRASILDYGINIEGGKVGHGSELEIKDEEEGTFKRKLERGTTFGKGTMNTINLYADLGFDISPVFLLPFGINIDKTQATSYFSATAGFSVGGHYSWGQEFSDPSAAAKYDQLLANKNPLFDDKYIDPRIVKPGFLGGWYFTVQIGAMSFRVQNYRYYGAPFASGVMYSVNYRFPIWKR